MLFLSRAAGPSVTRHNVPEQKCNVTKLKRLTDEVLDCQPGEGGIHRFFAIGASDNHFQLRSHPLGLFEDLPAGDSGQRDIEQDYINFIFVCAQ